MENNYINIIIENKYLQTEKDLIPLLFGDEDYLVLPEKTDMYDILLYFDIFNSKGIARRNWKKTGQKIVQGYSEYKKIGKYNKEIYIWYPIDTSYIKRMDKMN